MNNLTTDQFEELKRRDSFDRFGYIVFHLLCIAAVLVAIAVATRFCDRKVEQYRLELRRAVEAGQVTFDPVDRNGK